MLDPMSINVPTAGVSTDIPLIPEQDVYFQVAESSADPNKDGNGLNWNIKAVTIEPLTALDGRPISPNFPVYHVAALQAKEGSTDPQAYVRNLGVIQDALFGTTKDTRPNMDLALIKAAVGQKFIGHVIVDEYQGVKRNKLKSLKAVPA